MKRQKLTGRRKFTVSEAAQELRISTRTLMRWVKVGKIKTLRPGHKHLIPETEIERILLGQIEWKNAY